MAAVPPPRNHDWIPWLFVAVPILFYTALQIANSKKFRKSLNTPEIPAALSGFLALAVTAFPKATQGWGQPWLLILAFVLVLWILVAVLKREKKSVERHDLVMRSMAFSERPAGWKLNNEIHSLLTGYQKKISVIQQSGESEAEIQRMAGRLRMKVETDYYYGLHDQVAILVNHLVIFGVCLSEIMPHVTATSIGIRDIQAVSTYLPVLLRKIDTVEFE